MPKKFTNVIDRGRVTANKYNLTNNGDGTAIITDIESNINVPGTPLNKELFNPMQEGLIFTVETVHTIENSTDIYELEIDGLQGTSNLNGMPLFKGLSFNIKISETNTTNVVKIKISGNKYDLAKESGDTVVNLTVGELKRNRYYKVIFDSVRFTIPVEIIEYNPMFGANFGGLLGTPGTKKVGVAYYDVANNQTVVPTVENNLTYFESSKFIPISDYQTAKKLENLLGFKTTNFNISNFNGSHKCNSKTFLIGIHVNSISTQGNTKFSDIKWIPNSNGEWYATQIFSNFVNSEGFKITNKNGELKLSSIDANNSGVNLIAIYEIFLN